VPRTGALASGSSIGAASKPETSIMIKLSDTQRILLAAACQRADGSIFPLPSGLKRGGGLTKAIVALVRQELAVERETSDSSSAHRSEDDLHFGLFVTSAGMAAIGVGEDVEPAEPPAIRQARQTAVADKAPSKIGTVLALLSQDTGVAASELAAATGWLPHTVRAALTGLRKKGHSIERIKRDGITCYRILGAA